MTRAERKDADVRRARIALLGSIGTFNRVQAMQGAQFAVRLRDKGCEYVLVRGEARGRVRVDETAARAWPDDGTDGPLGIGEGAKVRVYGKGLTYPFRAEGRVVGMAA